jgi:hypothetical protein
MTREQLIRIVERTRDIEGETAETRDDLHDLFAASVPHPSAFFLVFSPELVTFDDRQLSPEEVVDLALSYKPTPLGPASDIADPS